MKSSLLDVGCAKGFMLYDLIRPIITVKDRYIRIYNTKRKKEVRAFVELGMQTLLV